MMRLILIFMVLTLSLSSCILDDPTFPGKGYQSEGEITGMDLRACACCGGWIIVIDGVNYRCWDLPNTFKIDYNELPVKVMLDWKKDEKPCIGDEILVTRIQRK